MITPQLLIDLAFFYTNTDRQKLERHGLIQEGKAGDTRWKRFNDSFDIFILKLNPPEQEQLAYLANKYINSTTPDPAISPPPAWKPNNKYEILPQTVEEWDWRLDGPENTPWLRSMKRLHTAGCLADSRAPDQMALVLRQDITRIIHRLTWLNARYGLDTERASEGITESVWIQNLKGLIKYGLFREDDRWKQIFIESLDRINTMERERLFPRDEWKTIDTVPHGDQVIIWEPMYGWLIGCFSAFGSGEWQIKSSGNFWHDLPKCVVPTHWHPLPRFKYEGTMTETVTLAPDVKPVAFRWRGIGEWLYGAKAPEGVAAEPLYAAPVAIEGEDG